MKRKITTYILILVILASATGLGAFAAEAWFVNGRDATVPGDFEGIYAIGSDGPALISGGSIYALSGSGLTKLGDADYTGGGGLRYDNKEISIRTNTVWVGLNYYYSSDRNSSVSTATLKNGEGAGFLFGCTDENGDFCELGATEESQICVTPAEGNCVLISTPAASSEEEPLFVFESSGRNNYLLIRAESDDRDESGIVYNYRSYRGDFGFAVLGNGKLTVANILNIESYVMGVCACEMSESWPVEALKAQAVAARTYVRKMIRNSIYYYTCGFDVTADTYCQAYLGFDKVGSNIEEAVEATANQYLTYNGSFVDALYSAADGGSTESNVNVFGISAHPYLTGIIDPYEAAAAAINPYSDWVVTMSPKALGQKVGIGEVETLEYETSDTDNVIKITLTDANGKTATVIRDSCRTVLGLKSIHYTISRDEDDNFVFEGGGCGHCLGMSQWGAYAMAKYYEKTYKDILGFYYTGVGLSYGIIE